MGEHDDSTMGNVITPDDPSLASLVADTQAQVTTESVSVQLPHTGSNHASPSSPSILVADAELPSRVSNKFNGFMQAEKLPGSEPLEICDGPQRPLFSLWPGRNRFFCNGFYITGGENDIPCCPSPSAPNLCAWMCILLPSLVYFMFVCRTLFYDVHPALPILTTLIFFITVCSLLGACFSDPGIIPRRNVILATNDRENLTKLLGYDLLGETGNGNFKDLSAEEIDALIPANLQDKGYRWCSTCKIIRPPRSSHCSYCDNCVMRFDHHCPFVNNCVGQRNLHFFFTFVASVGCLAVFVLPSIIWWLLKGNNDEIISISWIKYPLYVLLGVVCIAACLLLGLCGYQTYLICTGQTTREHLGGKKIENIDRHVTLCSKRGPRLFNPQALVVEGDLLKKKRPLWGRNRRRYLDEYYTENFNGKENDVENPAHAETEAAPTSVSVEHAETEAAPTSVLDIPAIDAGGI